MIEYPLAREEGPMSNSPDRTGTMRRRILVLDGDPETRMMLQELLEELGFDVLITSDGRTGLVLMGAELGRGLGVDGVLLDLLMPGVDTVLRELRDRYPEVPVIMTGEVAHTEALQAALLNGAADFLLKPIEPDLLRKKCFRVFWY